LKQRQEMIDEEAVLETEEFKQEIDAASVPHSSEPEVTQESILKEKVTKAVQHEPEESKEEVKNTE